MSKYIPVILADKNKEYFNTKYISYLLTIKSFYLRPIN